MPNTPPTPDADGDTDALLALVSQGDSRAVSRLLDRHCNRLKRMVAVRLDDRLAARVDPSDVVQETLMEATANLSRYASERPMAFYPWLRRLAVQRVARLHRTHLQTQKRAPDREADDLPLPDRSAWQLAERLVTSETGPFAGALRAERRRAVHDALESLAETDREVLVLRYLEQLSSAEIAAVLDTTPGAVNMRHLRALQRMRQALGESFGG